MQSAKRERCAWQPACLLLPPLPSPAACALLVQAEGLPHCCTSPTAASPLCSPFPNLQRHGASLTLTCVEMCDAQHPPEALCGPEGLLRQVRLGAEVPGLAGRLLFGACFAACGQAVCT